jgi:hypothetical protein
VYGNTIQGATILAPSELKGCGVVGDAADAKASGVLGRNSALGIGVRGTGSTGVFGKSTALGTGALQGPEGATLTEAIGVLGEANGEFGLAVLGRSDQGWGVRGQGAIGVDGVSAVDGATAITGRHTGVDGYGVTGEAEGEMSAGVRGTNRHAYGFGVYGEGGVGVYGTSETANYAAVAGRHTGSGYGVSGEGAGDGTAGVVGHHNGNGDAVRGENANGTALAGIGAYGARLEGTTAQLHLVPGGSAGRPGSGAHKAGELYLDSAGALFVCIASGTPGTWVKVATEPA